MRRIILSILGALLLTVGAADSAHAETSDPTWYICSDGTTMHIASSPTSGIVGYLPAGSQFKGRGMASTVKITDGARAGLYVPAKDACQTSTTGASEAWADRADRHLTRALELDNGAQRPDFYSRLAQGLATRSADGWSDPQALQYLDKVVAAQHSDGGFGIGYAWDAYSDGTENPADTAYTVTMATHVGDLMMSAYPEGLIEHGAMQQMIDKLESIPATAGQPDCMAYSDNPNDHFAGACIHNVNAAAAVFLLKASDLGFDVDEERAARMLMSEVAALKGGQWLYQTGNPLKPNDPDHGAYQLKSVNEILPELTQPIISDQMSRPLGTRSAEAHTVLAQLACADSMQWLAEHDARAVRFADNADRMAYLGWEAANAAAACR